jgi:hypothetical protein
MERLNYECGPQTFGAVPLPPSSATGQTRGTFPKLAQTGLFRWIQAVLKQFKLI